MKISLKIKTNWDRRNQWKIRPQRDIVDLILIVSVTSGHSFHHLYTPSKPFHVDSIPVPSPHSHMKCAPEPYVVWLSLPMLQSTLHSPACRCILCCSRMACPITKGNCYSLTICILDFLDAVWPDIVWNNVIIHDWDPLNESKRYNWVLRVSVAIFSWVSSRDVPMTTLSNRYFLVGMEESLQTWEICSKAFLVYIMILLLMLVV